MICLTFEHVGLPLAYREVVFVWSIRRNWCLRILQKFRNLEHALLDDLIEFFLNVTHQVAVWENVNEPITEPKVKIENVENGFKMNQIDDRLWDGERPVDLCAQPVERYRVVTTVLAGELREDLLASCEKI